jgi:hypothetical protein
VIGGEGADEPAREISAERLLEPRVRRPAPRRGALDDGAVGEETGGSTRVLRAMGRGEHPPCVSAESGVALDP